MFTLWYSYLYKKLNKNPKKHILFPVGGQSVPPDPSPTSTCPPGPPGPPAGANGSSDIMVNFDPDPADLALSSVPGQEAFDPRRHRFSEDELKPQPMIKKARKMLVPDEQKVLHLLQFTSVWYIHKKNISKLLSLPQECVFLFTLDLTNFFRTPFQKNTDKNTNGLPTDLKYQISIYIQESLNIFGWLVPSAVDLDVKL